LESAEAIFMPDVQAALVGADGTFCFMVIRQQSLLFFVADGMDAMDAMDVCLAARR
jgi:hypothetical protein